jgi:hypothetical protein
MYYAEVVFDEEKKKFGIVYWFTESRILGLWLYKKYYFEVVLDKDARRAILKYCPEVVLNENWW